MAEFLVLKKPHWAVVKPLKWSLQKFESRPMVGDITNVKPDGFYRVEFLGEGIHGWNRNTWNLLRLKQVSFNQVNAMANPIIYNIGPLEDPTIKQMIYRKHRYNIPIDSIPWNKHLVVINGVTVEECYYDLNRLNQVSLTDKTVS